MTEPTQTITDSEVERLRTELKALRSSINIDKEQRAARLRDRIADLELEMSRVRSELYRLLSPGPNREDVALQYDLAISNLVSALYKTKGSLTDSNLLMQMQIVRQLRGQLGLEK